MRVTVAAAVACLGGLAVMSLELTAVRLLAPHFGDSAFVWTNVIGVMLVALAAGAWLGGRLADRDRGVPRLALLFALGGAWTTITPLLGPLLGSWLLPQDLPLDAAMPALVRGSLAASLLLFAPAVTLVGCMTPMLVAALAAGDGRVGRASGLVASASTVGSLVGTFLTTHVLIPELGSRITLWACAAVLLLCAAMLWGVAWRFGAALLPLLLAPVDWGGLRRVPEGERRLAQVESRYQYLEVVETAEDGHRVVSLKINEGLDSFHSVAVEGTAYTGGRYYDYHAVLPFLVGEGERPAPLRVLSLGAAAGTFGRLYAAAHPACVLDSVELDPAVVELGERFFGGRGPSGRLFAGLDARVFAERATGPYEVVLVDAYEHQIYVPAHVASHEFFQAVYRLLSPGGVVSLNAGGRSFDDPVVQALARTLASVFGETWVFQVPHSRNYMLVARRDGVVDPGVLRPELAEGDELRAILEQCAAAPRWRRVGPGEPVLRDDRPLLDALQERVLAVGVGAGELLEMAGTEAPAQVDARARELRQQGDHEAGLAALSSASGPTSLLRFLAGDFRWLGRDLRGAQVEYQAALELEPDAQLSAALGERLGRLEVELEALERAESIGRSNGWIAASAAAVFVLAVGAAGARRRPARRTPA